MSDKRLPRILLIDDNPDAQSARQQELEKYARVRALHPDDVEIKDLLQAHLILVDYQIEDWPSRDRVTQLCLKPENGLALAAVLRAHLDKSNKPNPTVFAIYSAFLERLSGAPCEWSIARANNLEWAFPKSQSWRHTTLVQQMASLADAAVKLPKEWPDQNPEKAWNLVRKLLELPAKTPWERRALESIEECCPPIYSLSHSSHGLAFLRWFLQKILPYPCFLIDTHYLALRLKVRFESLEHAFEHGKRLSKCLGPFSYDGILGDFLGPRWWRSGIESFLWEITDGNSTDTARVHRQLQELTGLELEPLKPGEYVVTLNSEFRPSDRFHEISTAIRIQPEDWPPFADQAWTTLQLAAETASLRAIVLAQDKSRLAVEV